MTCKNVRDFLKVTELSSITIKHLKVVYVLIPCLKLSKFSLQMLSIWYQASHSLLICELRSCKSSFLEQLPKWFFPEVQPIMPQRNLLVYWATWETSLKVSVWDTIEDFLLLKYCENCCSLGLYKGFSYCCFINVFTFSKAEYNFHKYFSILYLNCHDKCSWILLYDFLYVSDEQKRHLLLTWEFLSACKSD